MIDLDLFLVTQENCYREGEGRLHDVERDEYGFELDQMKNSLYDEWHKKYDKQDRYISASFHTQFGYFFVNILIESGLLKRGDGRSSWRIAH